ncbi:DUF3297 family protein [Sphingomonas nostoxanthinifaciens]|uniref:DUF3297 family protein n=1 Tax=Sphingomonas nostoxanthinifaciens TaxID=2872652 RepID=UPI001CC20D9D|nr:DUF3297 family protein [Sphingomonas nostoxanthinifaciens]UAK24679.1 DUF3297 family protein [Sphingomonas nostoxanthinifaciens]
MTDQPTTPPDRLSVDPRSPYHDADALARGIGIVFKGTERFNVEEYCISEAWVRLAMSKSRDRKGNPLTMKLSGPVEPYFKDAAATPDAPVEGESGADKAE